MRTIVKILPFILLFACMPKQPEGDVQQLTERRDSLQNAQLDMVNEINELNEQIALLDTTNTTDELKLIKRIAIQKNKVVALNKKVKKLENDLASLHKTKKLVPVTTKTIKPEPFNHYIIVYGNVDARYYAQISPEMGGKIEKLHVEEGNRVAKGDLIVSLNTSAIQRQIEGMKSSLELTTSVYKKQKSLWDQKIGSEIDYLTAKNNKESLESQLESLKAQMNMSQIHAPFTGIVNKIYGKKGELANPGFPLVEIVNLDELEITADVPEKYMQTIKEGNIVEITFASIKDTLKKPVSRVSKVINDKTRTFEIELKLKNINNQIKPNMISTIRINDFSAKDAFVVPSNVISKDINGNYVYVVNNKNVVEKRYIKTGLSYNENTLVEDKLKEGDDVVVEGYHLVSSGMEVNIID